MLKEALREYAGQPTVATEMLIPRLVFMHVRLSMYEAAIIDRPYDVEIAGHYVPMLGKFRSSLEALQKLAGQPKVIDLNSYLTSKSKKESNGSSS
jgi:hypothetical protein